MLRWSWPVQFGSRKGRRRQVKGGRVRVGSRLRSIGRLRLEALEDRTLMAGDPFLTVVLAAHTILENAGPSATTGTVTRNNMDTSQALVVNLKSSDTTQVTVPASVTIPAGATSVNFNVGAVDNFVVDPTRTIIITAWAASPIAVSLDSTFGSSGYLSVPLQDNSSANFPGVKIQADGKILAVAASQSSGATWAISRSLTNGTLDTSFGTNGTAVTTFPGSSSGYANGIAIQPDGKIVVAGTVNTNGTFDSWGVARYNNNGTLDSTFGTGGLVVIKFTGEGGWLYDAAILSNGNILVGGMRQDPAGFAVGRLTNTGAVDTSFGTNGFAGINPDPSHNFVNTTGQAMIVQADGKILMTGIANGNGIAVARFNANGTPDTSFNGSGVQLIPLSAFGSSYVSGTGQDLTIQADGKIIVTGHVDPANFNDNWATARLNTDGSLDTSFNGTGTATISFAGGSDIANDVTVQADGKIIVAGRADVGATLGQGYNLALARYNPDGTLDSTFNGNGKIIFPPLPSVFEEIRDVGLQGDGKLAAVVGYNTDMRIARFDTGLLVASDSVNVTDTDGSILIPVTNHRDLVYDASRNILYITASDGSVQRYNIATQSLLSAWQVGTALYGADVTADDSSLYIAENQTSGSQGIVHKVNLVSGAVTNLTYTLAPGEIGAWDVAISANGKGLVTTQYNGSGAVSVPLRQLDTSNNTLSVRTDDPGSGGGGQIRQNSLLDRSADRSLLTLTESGDNGRVMTYSAGTDSFPIFSQPNLPLGNSLAAISRDGSLIAVDGSFAMVTDQYFHGVVNLPGIDGGVVFDPTRDVLYGVNSTLDRIFAFDTHTWAVKYFLPVSEDVGICRAFASGVMRVSDDGKLLFLGTPSGVRMYFLRLSTGVASSLSIAGFPSFATAGTSASFTVTALDPAGNVATAYTGTVSFASTDTAAVLPSNYTFTASDQGVHTFTVTLNTAGTQSLTATDSANSLTATEGNIVVHAAGASLIPLTTPRDLIYDAQRHMLYVTTSSGTVERYDLASGALLSPFQLIDPLNGGDITANGSALYVADGQRNLIQGFVDKIDLTSGIISRLTYDLDKNGEAGAWDLALGPGNLGLVTTLFPGTGDTPLHQVDTSTDTLSVRTDDPILGAKVVQFTHVNRGADRSEFILAEGNSTTAPFFTYNAANNMFSSQAVNTNTFMIKESSTVNRNGTLLALNLTGGVTIYDPSFNVLKVLTGVRGGLLFDPVRDLLYVASGGSSVAVYDTNTWAQTNTLAIGESIGGLQNFGPGMMSISNDGQWLFVITPSGVRIVSVPASPTSFSMSGLPASTQAGTTQSFTLTALDNLGHTATNYTGTVHFTSTDSQAGLPADYTFTAADNGVHTFVTTLKTAGAQTITATDTLSSAITGNRNITVSPAAASTLIVAGFPSPATVGIAGNFTVTARDPYNNLVTGYTGTVHFTSSDAQAALPADYRFMAVDAGQHAFSVTFNSAGTQSMTATDTVTNTITGSQTGIIVKSVTATSLIVAGFPSSTTAGVNGSFTVTARDGSGGVATGYTGTIHFSSSDPQAVLPNDYTFISADAGQHTFSAALRMAGSQSLTATDTSNNTLIGSEMGIAVNPAAASRFVVSAPAGSTAGLAFNLTVMAQDPFNNIATAYTGTVHFTSSDAQAILPADSTLSNGASTFSATLRTAANQTITATDSASSSITGTSNSIVVSAASATHFGISTQPAATAGFSFSFTVTAQDQFNNTAPSYTGTVHFTSSDGQATLPADSSLTSGTGTFNATFRTAGNQMITATDKANSSITGTSNSIQVIPGAPTHFAVNGPGTVTAGSAFSFTVVAQDQFNNTATSYSGTVHFSSSDNQAVLPADNTLSNGAGTFSATLKTATNLTPTSQSLTATDTGFGSITGSQMNITVNPGPATSFGISDVPLFRTAGVAFSFHVITKDNYGNVGASYLGTVHFTSSDPQAVLPANYTFTSADQGQFPIFPATFRTAGEQTITATDTVDSTITGTSSSSFVSAAAANHFAISAPANVTAGSAFSLTVSAQDAFKNTVTSYAGTVHFSTTAVKAVMPSNYTFSGPDGGVHIFSVILRSAGTQSVTVTDTQNSSISGQGSILVNPAGTNHLVVSQFPSKTTAGVSQSVKVTAQDMFGNTTPSYTGTVTFSSSDGHATLPANSTLNNGIGSFNATLRTAGSQSITAQDMNNSAIAPGTQAGIAVNPAAASRLQVSGFPSSVIAGTAHNFTVTALDPYDNVVSGYRGTVSFTSSDNQAALPGSYTFTSMDTGSHMFSATLDTASPPLQSITATDTGNSGITGTETGIAVVSMQPIAGISGPPLNASGSNGVPGQPLPFTLSATESGLPPDTVYTYSVQWGDGSPMKTFTGPSGLQVTHPFPSSASYTISLTATDPSHNGSLPASTSVSLTALALEPDPSGSGQALYLGGTTGADTIAITPAVRTVNNNLDYGVKVGMNMVSYGSFFSVSRVVVYGQAGADIIKTAAQTINGVFTNVSVPEMFFSGGDNDILNLTGSGSNAGTVAPSDVLVGGGGTDRLIGGQGRDILIGGAGLSTLQAGSGGDILIGGTTAYDNNAAALAAILAEWSSADDYATRIARLNGSMSGGLNGNYLLITRMGNANTVFDNGLADKLQGGAGMDWFFAGIADVILNTSNGEVVTPI